VSGTKALSIALSRVSGVNHDSAWWYRATRARNLAGGNVRWDSALVLSGGSEDDVGVDAIDRRVIL